MTLDPEIDQAIGLCLSMNILHLSHLN